MAIDESVVDRIMAALIALDGPQRNAVTGVRVLVVPIHEAKAAIRRVLEEGI
jgi:hypothetical protein